MSRWEPEARTRLERAALELYHERGFDRTTVAEIAARAGLAERTFFRYFADKREVLFGGSAALTELLVQSVNDAPAHRAPIEAIAAAFDAAAAMFEPRRDRARQRQAVITAHPELQERELIKLDGLAVALADALRRRGASDTVARLAAETGVAVFKIAFERWIAQTQPPESFATIVRRLFAELKAIATSA